MRNSCKIVCFCGQKHPQLQAKIPSIAGDIPAIADKNAQLQLKIFPIAGNTVITTRVSSAVKCRQIRQHSANEVDRNLCVIMFGRVYSAGGVCRVVTVDFICFSR